MPTCPACKESIETDDLVGVSNGRAALAVLRDWRVWALAFALSLAGGLLGAALGFSSLGALSGGATGVYGALRMGRMRRCPKCEKVRAFELPSKR
jgi:hypothetical protein